MLSVLFAAKKKILQMIVCGDNMDKYNYRKEMIKDIKEYITDNPVELDDDDILTDYYNWEEYWSDTLWGEDCITGNGPDGYDTEEKCQEYVATNLDLYFEAANEYDDFPNGGTPWIYNNPAKHMDATIRCYLLGECVASAIEELENDGTPTYRKITTD